MGGRQAEGNGSVAERRLKRLQLISIILVGLTLFLSWWLWHNQSLDGVLTLKNLRVNGSAVVTQSIENSALKQGAVTLDKIDSTALQILDQQIIQNVIDNEVLGSLYVPVANQLALGDIGGTFKSGLAIAANAVALGDDTTGDYVQSIVSGGGLQGSAVGEGAAVALAIGAGNGITVNDDDIGVRLHAAGGLAFTEGSLSLLTTCADGQILKSTASVGGWICTADNASELPCSSCIALGSETSGDYVAGILVGSGLSVSGSGGEGSTPTISVSGGFVTSSSADTFTNKTISGSSNTLTNIANSALTNSGLTFAGNSGSGSVALGGTLTIVGGGINTTAYSAGTLTVTGTEADTLASVTGRGATTTTALTLSNISNAITAGTLTATGGTINGTTIGATSASTGVFTTVNGLTITNNGTNTLTIAAGKTLTASNTLTFSGTDGTSFTLPSASDTLVGRASTDTLTNKTLTAPTINGTVATVGLTLPAFTAAGNITGSGSPTVSSFGTINGLTLTAAADGLTITGGTTPRTLTLTGANITIGSTITPTSAGTLTIQTNGANTLTIDAGGTAGINLGTTNANALTVGRSGVTTTVNGIADANNLKIGSGTTITKHLSATASLTSGAIAGAACNTIGTITVTGATTSDTVTGTPTPVSGGIETLNMTWNAYVSSANTVTIRGCNVTLLSLTPAAQTWRADVWQH